jgi:hypothetical protein
MLDRFTPQKIVWTNRDHDRRKFPSAAAGQEFKSVGDRLRLGFSSCCFGYHRLSSEKFQGEGLPTG